MRGDDDPFGRPIARFRGCSRFDQSPHGRGVLIQTDGIIDELARLLA